MTSFAIALFSTVALLDPWAECSHAKGTIKLQAEVQDCPSVGLRLAAKIVGCGETRTFASDAVTTNGEGVVGFTASWPDAKRWDFNTPQNRYTCTLTLTDASGATLAQADPFEFGFREVGIRGRDLLLNGTPIHLRFLLGNGNWAACKVDPDEVCRRLRGEGYNGFTDNYGINRKTKTFTQGVGMSACDRNGVAYFCTVPNVNDFGHARHFATNTAEQAAYRALAKRLIKVARNHPSVIAYAANHNAYGFAGDTDPMFLDGRKDIALPDGRPSAMARGICRTYEIIKSLDPTRPCYHHNGGNFNDIVAPNTYCDWAPRQERSEWARHWSEEGVKPLFFVEWGMPHIANWSSLRGPMFIWYNVACQSIVAAEAAAAFRGDDAYEDTPAAHAVLAAEERLWARQNPWWWRDDMHKLTFTLTNNLYGVSSWYMGDNLRCLRAYGLTGILPWDQWRQMFKPKPPYQYKGDRPDYIFDPAPATNWVRTLTGETIARWNQDDCCFIGGGDEFVDKRHIYRAGEKFDKRLVFVNDCRVPRTYAWRVRLVAKDGKVVDSKAGQTTVQPGRRGEQVVTFALPQVGDWQLKAEFSAPNWSGDDAFALTALAPVANPVSETALYDPKGLTAKEFKRLGIPYRLLKDAAEVRRNMRSVVIGRECLTAEILDAILSDDYNWAHAIIFEQTQETLESLGFRTQIYGLRETFPRFKDEALALEKATCHDWAGSSTLVSPTLRGRDLHHYAETLWCGYKSHRVFRCSNRGAVATVMIETPTRGDWAPLLDGGFNLQYTPLVDWRCDFARITFCQCDVTARTVPDPAADDLIRKLVVRMKNTVRKGRLPAIWTKGYGGQAFRLLMNEQHGMVAGVGDPPRQTRVVTSGAKKPMDFDKAVAEGARVLCIGLNAAETRAWAPCKVDVADVKGRYFERIENFPRELNGCSNADIAWHGAMDYAAFSGPVGEGNSALRVIRHGKGYYVFVQIAPWQINVDAKPYLRGTRRKAHFLINRIMGNMGVASRLTRPVYADAPEWEDDPYRFYRW